MPASLLREEPPTQHGGPAGLWGQRVLAVPAAPPGPPCAWWDPLLVPAQGQRAAMSCRVHSSWSHIPRAISKPRPARAVLSITEGVVEPAWLPRHPQPRDRGRWWLSAEPKLLGISGTGMLAWLSLPVTCFAVGGKLSGAILSPVGVSPFGCRNGKLP